MQRPDQELEEGVQVSLVLHHTRGVSKLREIYDMAEHSLVVGAKFLISDGNTKIAIDLCPMRENPQVRREAPQDRAIVFERSNFEPLSPEIRKDVEAIAFGSSKESIARKRNVGLHGLHLD